MMLGWFNARQATELGTALADHFATQTVASATARSGKAGSRDKGRAWQEFLQRAEQELRSLRLNFYKKAKFANSFKWRLLEKGVEPQLADEVTHSLVMRLSARRGQAEPIEPNPAPLDRAPNSKLKDLRAEGDRCMRDGAHEEAVAHYQALLALKPNHVDAHNNMGAALFKLARYADAEMHLRQAIRGKPNDAAALTNLGNLLRLTGRFEEAEEMLRRALKVQPSNAEVRSLLGMTFLMHGELADAKPQFEKVLKVAPRNADALVGLAQIAAMEGDFEASTNLFERVLDVNPDLPAALSAIAKLRRMTAADQEWLAHTQKVAEIAIDPLEQANLRFALGKYYDDVGTVDSAFKNYRRGNELMKSMARPYNREGHERFADDLLRSYTRDSIAHATSGASDSTRPVLLVGMPRSGTTLVEQIIASHPDAYGAGELSFWTDVIRQHETAVRAGALDSSIRQKVAEDYLRLLAQHSSVRRIVDKAPANTEYLGVIHSVFPRARIIHMQRDPLDTCLSCYFQQFSVALNFAMDLDDLAHYYRQFHRFMVHWRSVLPPGTILDVPYEELVADQEKWTRRIIEFLELEWDDRCLNFQETKRVVATASTWQVRQKMHSGSVQRWRKYSKYVGPLRELEKLAD